LIKAKDDEILVLASKVGSEEDLFADKNFKSAKEHIQKLDKAFLTKPRFYEDFMK